MEQLPIRTRGAKAGVFGLLVIVGASAGSMTPVRERTLTAERLVHEIQAPTGTCPRRHQALRTKAIRDAPTHCRFHVRNVDHTFRKEPIRKGWELCPLETTFVCAPL